MVTVAAFYQFKDTPNYQALQPKFEGLCDREGIKGTILLATEGINGTVAGSRQAIDKLKNEFHQNGFCNLEYKESFAKTMPFFRMKVRLKKEIVTLGVPGVSPTCQVGTYVEPCDWNALIARKDVITIDTRNHYEYMIGTFKGAINPCTDNFRQFPEFIESHYGNCKDRSVAMFCTGGIRCEKSTSLLLSMGFKDVYHLKGGILSYLEHVKEEDSLWQGECFVFDQRIAVTHGLKIGTYTKCHGCRMPLSQDDLLSPDYELGVSCHYCHDSQSQAHFKRVKERQKQMVIAQKKGIVHIGDEKDVRGVKHKHAA